MARWQKVMPSRYGATGLITWPQALAEAACERKAALQKVKLVPRFWLGEWAREFRTQLNFANKLLNRFGLAPVRAAWEGERGKRISSLGSDILVGLVRREAEKAELVKEHGRAALELPEPIPMPDLPPRGVPFVSGKSIVEQLRELE
jgi:hypothetical protein